jgi:cbb3-type cytochrome oxidase cytochrome c subunit
VKRRQLKLKRDRIEQIKTLFISSEFQFLADCQSKQITTLSGRIEARRSRGLSCPSRLHQNREAGEKERIREQERQLSEFRARLQENQGTITELTSVIANLAAVRFLLEQVQVHSTQQLANN